LNVTLERVPAHLGRELCYFFWHRHFAAPAAFAANNADDRQTARPVDDALTCIADHPAHSVGIALPHSMA
jgi:hypothetical protein